MRAILNIPNVINIYDEGITGINFRELKQFIRQNFGNIKVSLIKLKKKVVHRCGLLFDFIATQNTFAALERTEEKNSCQIILTEKLFATLDEDKRPHIRASIYGFPSVISLSGIVEGPAKPKNYYLYKQKYAALGIWEREQPKIKQKFRQQFIDYQDKRLTDVLKGYIAQALFFYIVAAPFCPYKSCRLFNSHWQEDLIYSQIKLARFCKRHEKALVKVRNLTLER